MPNTRYLVNPDRTILTIEEFRRIKRSGFSASVGTRSGQSPSARTQDAAMFELLFTTGIRLGEAASLTVSQVQSVKIENGQDVGLLFLDRYKWNRPRPVCIDKRVLDVLREHTTKGRAELGGAPDSGALWLTDRGLPVHPSHWTRAFRRAAVRSDHPGRLEGVSAQALRRSWTVHICQFMRGTPGLLNATNARYDAFVSAEEIHRIGRFFGASDLLRGAIHQLALACR
ncbi:site-specific recombinase XerD [Arthrobacter sp. GAS37]|uniref:tyrosine-type recombinase/integrase n=1 Tax=Arthrobacter sp. GAS37 TaxID=3156261 RepID=UPI003836A3FF